MTDLYDILLVDRDASPHTIKAAYRRLVKTHHPDAGGDRTLFEQIQRAYDTLMDAEKRRIYDATGAIDDEPAENPDAGAIATIDSIINVVLGNEEKWKGSFLDQVRRAVAATKADTEAKISELDKKRRTSERTRRKIQRKAEAKAIIEPMLDRQIEELTAAIADGNEYVVMLDRCTELLVGYSIETPPARSDFADAVSLTFYGLGAPGRSPFGSGL